MTSQRYVTLPNGRACGLGKYVAAWRKLRKIVAADPDAQVSGFDYFPCAAWEVLRDLRVGMHDRINKHDPRYGHGRKWSSDWQRAATHCANAVNTPRLIVRYVPPDFRVRLAHRVSCK